MNTTHQPSADLDELLGNFAYELLVASELPDAENEAEELRLKALYKQEIEAYCRTATADLLEEAENYGRIAALKDLLTWLKLHEIEDVTMVQEYVEHVETSIKQTPDQRYVEYPELRRTLLQTKKAELGGGKKS